MRRIQKVGIDNNQTISRKQILTPRNTGWAAAAGMSICTARALTKKKPITKSHKTIGWITAGLTLLHIILVETRHLKRKNNSQM